MVYVLEEMRRNFQDLTEENQHLQKRIRDMDGAYGFHGPV